jgi:adenylosuccinate synthase
VEIDKAEEELRSHGGQVIGTTKSGVGPSASSYIAREGMKMADLLLPDPELKEKTYQEVERINRKLGALKSAKQFEPSEIFREFKHYGEFLKPYIQNTFNTVRSAVFGSQAMVAELSQAYGLGRQTGIPRSLASVDTTFAPLAQRYHFNERRIGHKVGILKVAETAVGNHILYAPIPLDIQNIIYERTAARGRAEQGAVSGRKRDLQWMQLPMIKGAIETMGLTELVIKKLDVLDKVPYIEIGTHYIFPDGVETDIYDPEDPRMMDERTTMRTIRMPGWMKPTADITRFEDMPSELKALAAVIEKLTGVPVVEVGNGPNLDGKVTRQGYPYTT